jgi:beta-lactamase class A
VVAIAASVAGATPSDATAEPRLERWRPALEQARSYAAVRAGRISFAVRTRRKLYRSDAYRSYPSASVVKAMLLVAYLNHATVRHRPLGGGDRALLEPMVRWSDNVTATQIRNFVGNGALEQLARRVGMARFHTHPIWGSTGITAAGQTKLFLRIDRFVVRRHRKTAMRLLGSVVAAQRWGVARAAPPSWALYFKGGWGSGSGAVDHQVALLRRGRRRVAVAVLTTGSPTHEYGKETLEGVARRLLRGLGPRSLPR